MIEIEEVAFGYGESDFVLRIPEFRVREGEAVALVGPSGSGKTTLLQLIAGILVSQEGRVRTEEMVWGTMGEQARRKARIRKIGLVFQEFELLEHLSGMDNILLPYRLDGVLRLDSEARKRAGALAEEMEVGRHLKRYPGNLSQGERQRVAICRALVTEPKLILADEPTGNLDPANKGKVLDLLLEYGKREGATIVVVTHDHGLLDRFERVEEMCKLRV